MRIQLIDFGGKHEPARAHHNDAGADVFAPRGFTLGPHETRKVPLGFGIALPDGFAAFVFPRSSLSAQGIVCELPPIDSGYRGEIHAVLSNLGPAAYTVHAGDRIGQLVVVPVVLAQFTTEPAVERGTEGLGSTGR